MATSEHKKLSSYIKSIHDNLRKKADSVGVEKAWVEHCANKEILKEYACAMKTLANSHWENNFLKNQNALSRIEWTYNYSLEYFKGISESLLITQREKELDIAKKLGLQVNNYLIKNDKLKLLDVGSCYNPFNEYDIFDVLAIDIAPSHKDVQDIDFLNISIGNETILNQTAKYNKLLIPSNFDIVVFSLFLEYLPDPDLRRKSCEKAYQLLKHEGILFIISPDSSHVGTNAQIIKSWRFVLAEIGFSRIKYEKLPHLHCMVFRKSLHINITRRWAELHANHKVFDNIFIPQDFSKKLEYQQIKEAGCELEKDEHKLDFFSTLPFSDEDF